MINILTKYFTFMRVALPLGKILTDESISSFFQNTFVYKFSFPISKSARNETHDHGDPVAQP